MLLKHLVSKKLLKEGISKLYLLDFTNCNYNPPDFLTDMEIKYKIPVKKIFESQFFNKQGFPISPFRKNGWIVTGWALNYMVPGYYRYCYFTPEAYIILEYIFKTLSLDLPNTTALQPSKYICSQKNY